MDLVSGLLPFNGLGKPKNPLFWKRKVNFGPPFELSDGHAQAGTPVENQFGIADPMSGLLSFNGLGKHKASLV